MIEALLVINGVLIGLIVAGAYAKYLTVEQASKQLKEAAEGIANAQIVQAKEIMKLRSDLVDVQNDVNARRLR